jgi:hypothetical protein
MPLTSKADEPEVISPELVLVDPELARRVRPIEWTGAWSPAVRTADATPTLSIAPRPVEAVVDLPREAGRTRSLPSLRSVVLAAATAGAGFAAGALLFGQDGTTTSQAQVAAGDQPRPSQARPASRPKAAAHVARRAAQTRRTPTRASAGSRAPAHTSPSRSSRVSWQQTRFATFYNVVFVRGRSRRLELWTRQTELSVQVLRRRSDRGLGPGTYRWFVRPGYGNPRLRKLPGRTFYGPVVSRGMLIIRQ